MPLHINALYYQHYVCSSTVHVCIGMTVRVQFTDMYRDKYSITTNQELLLIIRVTENSK